jgi:5-methylcytosine-specific restriction endonuclease McrA
MAFSSMWAFCEQHLGLTHGETFRRTNAAALLARFPVVGEYLADGRLSLTTLVELRKVLDEASLDGVLARAAGKSEDEVKRLVAALAPREAPADLLRRCPAAVSARPALAPPEDGSARPALAAAQDVSTRPALVPADPPVSARPALAPRTTVALDPIAEDRHLLRATVTDAFRADLEAVRAALSHQLPGGALGDVLHHCLRVTLAACEKRRRGAGRAAAGELVADSRYLPAALRDAVWRRDEGRCAFVADDGRRCGGTWQLEIHHLVPFARDATATLDGLALRCRAHNQQQARQDFGEAEVERAIAARQGRLC